MSIFFTAPTLVNSLHNNTKHMTNTHRARKQWCLFMTGSVNSFEHWKQILIYSPDKNFSPYLAFDAHWGEGGIQSQPLL